MDAIEILYEDRYLIAVVKPSGMLSEESTHLNVVTELKKQTGLKELHTVHRLDREVSGVFLLAKDTKTAGNLSAMIAERKVGKEYFACVHGKPAENSGEMRDLLFRDAKSNKSFVVDRVRAGVREAVLDYETLASVDSPALSLVRIRLHTGRTHQIRVQFSHRKMPLFGDGRYGGRDSSPIALRSVRLSFVHPVTKKEIVITAYPDRTALPWSYFPDVFS